MAKRPPWATNLGATNLAQIREMRGLSQKAFGESIGISEKAYQLYETGKREPRFATLQRVSETYRVSIDAFMCKEPPSSVDEPKAEFDPLAASPRDQIWYLPTGSGASIRAEADMRIARGRGSCGTTSILEKPAMVQTRTGTSQLGHAVATPHSPEEAVLERVRNPHPDVAYVARFTAPEFTSLCPVTGQPDFARLVIDYVPADWLVESKSLKLYLVSYRNHGAFHEDCTLRIGKDLCAVLEPRWFRIGAYFFPRGGMPIDVFWSTGELPPGLWVPDQGVPPYLGRG